MTQTDGKTDSKAEEHLEFITFTNIRQTTNPETRKTVRSRAMRHYQRKLRDGKTKGSGEEVVLDISPLLHSDHSSSLPRPHQDPRSELHTGTLVPLFDRLGAGRADPFANYPIRMNMSTLELVDHLHGDSCPMLKAMSRIGFFQTMVDPGGFRQILYTSAKHLTRLRHTPESPDQITLCIEAIRSINNRLGDPIFSTSDDIISSVLAFACHAVIFDDLRGSLVHFGGVQELIRRRGGLNTLKTNAVLRLMLFWYVLISPCRWIVQGSFQLLKSGRVDVNIACMSGHAPHFPPPEDLLPEPIAPNPSNMDSILKFSDVCQSEIMASTMTDLQYLNARIISGLVDGTQNCLDDLFAGLYLVPILHRLLSIPFDNVGHDPALLRREASRNAAILYVAALRSRLGVDVRVDIHAQRLKDVIVAQNNADWAENTPILLWMLIVGGLQSRALEKREWFVSAMSRVIMESRYVLWEEISSILHNVLWIEGLFGAEIEIFRRHISANLFTLYGYIFS